MITSSNSLFRERDAQSNARRLLHAMGGFGLSRVRTELERWGIVTSVPPHPVQPSCHPPTHRYLGNALVSTHRQMNIPTPPVQVGPHCRLRGLHEQETQQTVALLRDVPQPLLAGAGVLTRNHAHI